MTRHSLSAGVLVFALLAHSALASELSPGAAAKANAWVGRDASALLLDLRVDGNRVNIAEDNATMETRYTWRTVTPAWTEKVKVSGGKFMFMESTGNGQRPVYSPIVYDEIDHPDKHRCEVTYVADSEGVVRRWEQNGPDCNDDIVGPKNP